MIGPGGRPRDSQQLSHVSTTATKSLCFMSMASAKIGRQQKENEIANMYQDPPTGHQLRPFRVQQPSINSLARRVLVRLYSYFSVAPDWPLRPIQPSLALWSPTHGYPDQTKTSPSVHMPGDFWVFHFQGQQELLLRPKQWPVVPACRSASTKAPSSSPAMELREMRCFVYVVAVAAAFA